MKKIGKHRETYVFNGTTYGKLKMHMKTPNLSGPKENAHTQASLNGLVACAQA